MPKTISGLFEPICTFENLWRSAKRAKQGCRSTWETARFFFHLEREILSLQKELISGAYRPGRYRYFKVYDPKERLIAVAPFRDRVVHHAVVGVLTPLYERSFIFDSYATRPIKGTHAAVQRAQGFLRKNPWYLKADIAQYFSSIDHDILLGILRRKLKEEKLLGLLERIIRNTSTPGKGLPVGNLTSQFLANVYLDVFDHYVKEVRGIKPYIRYMDDFVVFSNAKSELAALRDALADFLRDRLGLRYKPGGVWINRASHGLSFLGMRIFAGTIRVCSANYRRSRRRIDQVFQAWARGEKSDAQLSQAVNSSIAYLRYFAPGMAISVQS